MENENCVRCIYREQCCSELDCPYCDPLDEDVAADLDIEYGRQEFYTEWNRYVPAD